MKLCEFCKLAERHYNQCCPNPACKVHFGFVMEDLYDIQKQVSVWHTHNFGPTIQHHCIYGMMEELGELAHAVLKEEQGIRSVNKYAVEDAIGDLAIYTMDLCNHLGLNYFNIIYKTWQQVKQRNWKKFPINGVDK